MPTSLRDISKRIANPTPFFKAMFKDLSDKMLTSLKSNTPGETLWNEWEEILAQFGERVEMIVLNRRLHNDRGTWEPIFHYLNEGTRTRKIKPANALALRWEDKQGNIRFSKGHEIKGIKPAYFAEQADRIIADFENSLEKKWARWIETGRYS